MRLSSTILFITMSLIIISLPSHAQISKEACYCYIFKVVDITSKPDNSTTVVSTHPEQYSDGSYNYAVLSITGDKNTDYINAFVESRIMPKSLCKGKVVGRTKKPDYDAPSTGGTYRVRPQYWSGKLYTAGPTVTDQDVLLERLTSYIDQRHEEVKSFLYGKIAKINQEEMNTLLTDNSFLLKKGIEQVLRDSAFVMVEKSIAEAVEDPEFVREKLIKALEEYEAPADTLSTDVLEGSPE